MEVRMVVKTWGSDGLQICFEKKCTPQMICFLIFLKPCCFHPACELRETQFHSRRAATRTRCRVVAALLRIQPPLDFQAYVHVSSSVGPALSWSSTNIIISGSPPSTSPFPHSITKSSDFRAHHKHQFLRGVVGDTRLRQTINILSCVVS